MRIEKLKNLFGSIEIGAWNLYGICNSNFKIFLVGMIIGEGEENDSLYYGWPTC
jgi:hypothetical protein